ncbi:L-ascorbate metabolism protein UlaG, beta-lactamase superfamily [Cupriavidus sp. YR651]|uniref:metal-dependent hydrolase n=1 Tax=Cupriavidus sp. YR651 TaxID=1855315 RepID=UPI000881C909|nr:metal-dependent hydrolase [Cupriavidus sp. YR651]SDC68455.1 L-ascorbate metabolism protein UlaG, beta-lactamase superfamily [Cupriavidus sp. YR651]
MIRCRMLFLAAAVAVLAGCASSVTTSTAGAQQPKPPGQIAAGKAEVLWLGQAATRITTPGGKVIVIDPWLTTNPKTPADFKQLAALGKVDLILVTHAHGDHLGDAPALAKLNNAPIYTGGGMGQTLVSLGMVPAALSQRFGKSGTIAPFGAGGPKITAVRAEHSSELVWKNPTTDKDETHYAGEPVGYIIELENGFKIWHMGDTGLFGDMELIGERYKPDLVLIPIGGHFTMGPQDAAIAVRDMIKPRYAIPIHYQTTPQLRGTPAEFSAALGASARTSVLVPEPGQKVDF